MSAAATVRAAADGQPVGGHRPGVYTLAVQTGRHSVPRLGPRGEGWVVLQFTLLGLAVAASVVGVRWPPGARPVLEPVGAAVLAAGALLFILGLVALGRSLTPLPRPLDAGRLCRNGVYRHVRHPIYGGLLLAVTGWSLAVAPLALPVAAVLGAVLALKSRSEEAWLVERYPEYAAYQKATPRRFLPWPF